MKLLINNRLRISDIHNTPTCVYYVFYTVFYKSYYSQLIRSLWIWTKFLRPQFVFTTTWIPNFSLLLMQTHVVIVVENKVFKRDFAFKDDEFAVLSIYFLLRQYLRNKCSTNWRLSRKSSIRLYPQFTHGVLSRKCEFTRYEHYLCTNLLIACKVRSLQSRANCREAFDFIDALMRAVLVVIEFTTYVYLHVFFDSLPYLSLQYLYTLERAFIFIECFRSSYDR